MYWYGLIKTNVLWIAFTQDYTRQIDNLQQQVDAAERRVREEKEAHEATKEQLEAAQSEVSACLCCCYIC